MTKQSTAIINELNRNKNFMGTCPECGDDFRLADSSLFSLDDKPPAEALKQIEEIRARIKDDREALAKRRELITKKAKITAEAVNLGKIVEKIVPSFASFSYTPGDCRALFEPIDYLIFSGLTATSKVDALFFVDVKSGGASLNKRQKEIKSVVERGSIHFSISKS